MSLILDDLNRVGVSMCGLKGSSPLLAYLINSDNLSSLVVNLRSQTSCKLAIIISLKGQKRT